MMIATSEIGGWISGVMVVPFVLVLAGGLIYGSIMWRKWKRDPVKTEERERATREAFENE